MFKIYPIESGSKGNMYIIENEDNAFIIDCGVPFNLVYQLSKNIPKSVIKKIKFVTITHEHSDHIKNINDLISLDYPIYCSKGTADAISEIKELEFNYNQLENEKEVIIKNIEITPLDVKHDTNEPLGFYFKDLNDNDTILFLTDIGEIPYLPKEYNKLILEVNHDLSIVNQEDKEFYKRSFDNHLSLNQALNFFDMYKPILDELYIIHLSQRFSNPHDIKDKLIKRGYNPHVLAQNGKEY